MGGKNITKTAHQLHTSSVNTMTAMPDKMFHKRNYNNEMSSLASIFCRAQEKYVLKEALIFFSFAISSRLRKMKSHKMMFIGNSRDDEKFPPAG